MAQDTGLHTRAIRENARTITVSNHLGASTAKIAVWAHNSHLGDARATKMGDHGELNVGQLVRQRYGKDAVLAGFTTYTGTVTAASNWDAPAERKRVRPALAGSYEDLFHATEIPNFLLPLRGATWISGALNQEQLQRATGVIYFTQTQRRSHYLHASRPN